MTCNRAMDLIMGETAEHSERFIDQVRVSLHLLHCRRCGNESQRLRRAIRLMRTDFLPSAPDLSAAIMAVIRLEVAAAASRDADSNVEEIMPFRHWIVGGLLLVASLAVSPLGAAFDRLVRILGSDLVFPISLTLGVVLTAYCALFIGSHLDELSERFGISRET